MRELLLLAGLAAVLAFGWLLMRRLDRYLSQMTPADVPADEAPELRLGFSDPLAAGGLAGILERYDKAHPEVRIRLLSGTADELLDGLSARRLDLIFLTGEAAVPLGLSRQALTVPCAAVAAAGKWTIGPIAARNRELTVLWVSADAPAAVRSLLAELSRAEPQAGKPQPDVL